MWTVSLAEAFIHVFQTAGKIFLDMMTGLIPMLICLLLAINFLMKLVGTIRMEKVAALLGRSRHSHLRRAAGARLVLYEQPRRAHFRQAPARKEQARL